MFLGRVLLAGGVALIAHAAFAAAQYLALVQTRYSIPDATAPSDVVFELAVAFVAVLAGALATAPAFASIYTAGGAPMECVGRGRTVGCGVLRRRMRARSHARHAVHGPAHRHLPSRSAFHKLFAVRRDFERVAHQDTR